MLKLNLYHFPFFYLQHGVQTYIQNNKSVNYCFELVSTGCDVYHKGILLNE